MSEQTPPPVEPESIAPAEPTPVAPADASPATPPVKLAYPFSVLRVLATALRVAKHNFVPFMLLACVLEAPVVLLRLDGAREHLLITFLVQIITHALTQAVVVYGVIMEMQGSRPSTSTCIQTGFAQLGRVLGVSVVSGLAIVGAMVLFVIPGIIVWLMLYVVVPVTLVEGLGIRAAMKRSRELTNGRKGDLFLMMILSAAVGIASHRFARLELGYEAAVVWGALSSAVTTMFFSVTAAVSYIELRKLRDGLQIPEIAAAFARIRK